MKTLIIMLLFATSLSAQYANKIESKTFVADQKIIGSDTLTGKWTIYIAEEWGGKNHHMRFNGEFLYLKDNVYRSKNTTVTIDYVNTRFEVRTKDETYYLTRSL